MSIDIVAIDVDPVVWAVQCGICDGYVSEGTQDDDLADELYRAHCASHGVSEE